MASGRTLSARRLHRHQHVETRRECRRLLQQARDVRAMDQGGKRRNQVDTAVMSVIRRQRGSSTASCAGLQSRQFSAHAGDAGADQGVVADEPEGKADQDRREDRQPWPLCRVSDGRSRHSQKSLCRHSADDRGTAAAARCIDSVMRSVSRIPSKTGGKVRLDDGKFGKFSVRLDFGTSLHSSQTCPRRSGLANNHEQTQSCLQSAFIWRMSDTTHNGFNNQEKPMSTSSTTSDSSAPSANRPMIRVGLIGVGNWALNGPVRVLSLMPQYEMAAVYSQRRDAAQSAADTFGIRHVVGSIDELVRHPDVDIVLVLTTGPQHEEAVRAAIAAGKTVYCEWPLTPDSKTSAELVDLAAEAGVQTILGTQRRFAPGLRYLKDLLGDGYVGRVRSVRRHVTVSSFGKNRSKALRWSAFPENFMGVTSIFGAHLMDPLFSIVGRPTEISAVSVNQWPEITIVETGEEISTKVPDQLLLQGILASGAVFAVHIEGGKHHGTGVQI